MATKTPTSEVGKTGYYKHLVNQNWEYAALSLNQQMDLPGYIPISAEEYGKSISKLPAYSKQYEQFKAGTGMFAGGYINPDMIEKQPTAYDIALKGRLSGEAAERERLGQVGPYDMPTTQTTTLESIQAGLAGVAGQIPGIQAGIKDLSATDLVDGAGTIDPVVGGTTVAGDGDTAISNTTGIQQMIDTMMAQKDKEVADLKKQQEDNRSFFTKMLDKKTSSKDILKEEYEAVEDSPAYKEVKRIKALIEPLNLQMADLSNKETAEIENARNLGMSEGWMDRKETELHNKYNRLKAPIATMLNAHAANALLYQGEVDEAYKYAYAAANAATYDQEFEYNTMKDFMDRNDDFLNSLQETDRFYFTNALDLAKDSLNIARDDANYVMDLQMQSGGQAGINPNDTRQQAQAKFARWSGQQPTDFDLWKQKVDYEAGITGGITTTEGIATGAIEQDLRESVTGIIADLTEGKGTSGFSRTERMAVFNEVRKKLRFLYNTKEVSDTAMNNMINQALELKPSTTTTTIPNISQMTNEQMVNSWLNIDLPTGTEGSTQYKL